MSRVLKWSPQDEQMATTAEPMTAALFRRKRPAPWPVVMLAQRLAWRSAGAV